jgi:hypothetical protein
MADILTDVQDLIQHLDQILDMAVDQELIQGGEAHLIRLTFPTPWPCHGVLPTIPRPRSGHLAARGCGLHPGGEEQGKSLAAPPAGVHLTWGMVPVRQLTGADEGSRKTIWPARRPLEAAAPSSRSSGFIARRGRHQDPLPGQGFRLRELMIF